MVPGELNVPLALHFTHSHSLKAPGNSNTIGGQWLDHGVYAYVGSVDEPRLPGFVPPKVFADRWRNLVPFLIAGRKWDNSPAWKINTLGDPLMICRPPSLEANARRPAPDVADDDDVDLGEHVKTLMRRAAEDETGDAIAEALATLDLLGKDSVAIRMWQLAGQRGLANAAAPAKLPIRAQDRSGAKMIWVLASISPCPPGSMRRRDRSLPEPFQDRRHVHLVRLVIAG